MTKILLFLIAIALALGVTFAVAPSVAHAEDDDRPGMSEHVGGFHTEKSEHSDEYESHDAGMALLFWAFAAASVGGALFVVTRKNLIAAVMGMVGSFIGIAAVYMMLYASFLAVLQMLVYAGAIMVLFVFVIMILNRPEDEPVAPSGRAGQAVAGLAILYLVGRLAMILMNVNPVVGKDKVEAADKQYQSAVTALEKAKSDAETNPRNANPNALKMAKDNVDAAELQLAQVKGYTAPVATKEGHTFGSVGAVGTDLFGDGLFPFEAISILLLIAVVGAIAIARPLHEDPHVDGNPVHGAPPPAEVP